MNSVLGFDFKLRCNADLTLMEEGDTCEETQRVMSWFKFILYFTHRKVLLKNPLYCFSRDIIGWESWVIDKVVHRLEDDISATFVHEGWRVKYDDGVMYPWCLEVLDEDGYPHGLIEELYKTTGVYFNGKKKILVGME